MVLILLSAISSAGEPGDEDLTERPGPGTLRQADTIAATVSTMVCIRVLASRGIGLELRMGVEEPVESAPTLGMLGEGLYGSSMAIAEVEAVEEAWPLSGE